LAKYEYENTLKNNTGLQEKKENAQKNTEKAPHEKAAEVIENIQAHHHQHAHHSKNSHDAHMAKSVFSHGHDHHKHSHPAHQDKNLRIRKPIIKSPSDPGGSDPRPPKRFRKD
jgi:hypothetical protein